MKAPFRAFSVLLALAVGASAATQPQDDESAVRRLVPRWEQAWNAHDMSALAALFTEDADFVNVGARHWKGRAQIETQHAARASQFVESVWTTGQTTVQFLTPDIALVHGTWGMRGDKDPEGTRRPPRDGTFTWVAVKKGGDWLIRAAQNTNRGNQPAPPGVGGTPPPAAALPAAALSPECSFGVKFQATSVAPITIRMPGNPLRTVFKAIETISFTQFRVPEGLDYRVRFDMRDVPPCRALEIIGESQGLTYRQEGATIVVVAPEPAPPPVVP